MDFVLIIGVIGFITAIIFGVIYFSGFHKMENIARKIDKLSIGYEFKAGGQINGLYLSYPLLNIKLEKDGLCFSYSNTAYKILYSEVLNSEVFSGIISNGIKIMTKLEGQNNQIVIWSPLNKHLHRFLCGLNMNSPWGQSST